MGQRLRSQAAEKGEEPTIVDMLVQIPEEAELFHDAAKDACGTIQVDGHFETWPVCSKGFRLWLRRRLREEHDKAAYSEALQSASEEVESKAQFECPQMEASVRVAEADGAVWLDLADEAWRGGPRPPDATPNPTKTYAPPPIPFQRSFSAPSKSREHPQNVTPIGPNGSQSCFLLNALESAIWPHTPHRRRRYGRPHGAAQVRLCRASARFTSPS